MPIGTSLDGGTWKAKAGQPVTGPSAVQSPLLTWPLRWMQVAPCPSLLKGGTFASLEPMLVKREILCVVELCCCSGCPTAPREGGIRAALQHVLTETSLTAAAPRTMSCKRATAMAKTSWGGHSSALPKSAPRDSALLTHPVTLLCAQVPDRGQGTTAFLSTRHYY